MKAKIVLGSIALSLALAFAAIALPSGPEPVKQQAKALDGPDPICRPGVPCK